MGRPGTEWHLGARLQCLELNPGLLRDRNREPIPCKASQSLLPVLFFRQLEDTQFVPVILLPQQGLDPNALDPHMFPIILSQLLVTTVFPPGLDRQSVTIPFEELLANRVFLFRKLLANGFFPVRWFFVAFNFSEGIQVYLAVFFPVTNLVLFQPGGQGLGGWEMGLALSSSISHILCCRGIPGAALS